MGLLTGSEGLLGVVTEVTVRILRKPTTARAVLIGFPSSAAAGATVAAVIGAGIIPGGMEMMINRRLTPPRILSTPAIRATPRPC